MHEYARVRLKACFNFFLLLCLFLCFDFSKVSISIYSHFHSKTLHVPLPCCSRAVPDLLTETAGDVRAKLDQLAAGWGLPLAATAEFLMHVPSVWDRSVRPPPSLSMASLASEDQDHHGHNHHQLLVLSMSQLTLVHLNVHMTDSSRKLNPRKDSAITCFQFLSLQACPDSN